MDGVARGVGKQSRWRLRLRRGGGSGRMRREDIDESTLMVERHLAQRSWKVMEGQNGSLEVKQMSGGAAMSLALGEKLLEALQPELQSLQCIVSVSLKQ